MINKLNDIASKFYIADFEFPKALAKEEIAEELKLDNLHLIDDYVDFIENYEGDGLIITGSLYFISEVKAKLILIKFKRVTTAVKTASFTLSFLIFFNNLCL